MKNIVLILVLLFSSVSFSQNIKKEKIEDLIKVTYYNEDGTIHQEGTFKNNKLHGKWVMYDSNQDVKTLAFYDKGEKHGLWIIKDEIENKITEILYVENELIFASTYSKSKVPIDSK